MLNAAIKENGIVNYRILATFCKIFMLDKFKFMYYLCSKGVQGILSKCCVGGDKSSKSKSASRNVQF